MTSNTSFDDSEKIQILIKKAFQVPSTFETTAWYNESQGVAQTILEAGDINTQIVPVTPIWNITALNQTELESYGIRMNPTYVNSTNGYTGENFASEYSSLNINSKDGDYFSKSVSMNPGCYIDTTGNVMLFVRLRLDKMKSPSTSAIAYTKYHYDSSLNSILDNAFQFNYNTQLNVPDSTGNDIAEFKPYSYKLEYSINGSSFDKTVTSDIGNWFFDFKSGILSFADDPTVSDSDVDLDTGELYFTFVKYVGPRGLDKMISVDSSFNDNSGNSYYENQLVVDSTNQKLFLYKNDQWSSINDWESSNPIVNNRNQTFFQLMTESPPVFTSSGYSSSTSNDPLTGNPYEYYIDISWNFDDIIPSTNNRFLNLSSFNQSQRVLPCINKIYFDISSNSSNETGMIDNSYYLTIDQSHDYVTSTYSTSYAYIQNGSQSSSIQYQLTYSSLRLKTSTQNSNIYTVSVWGQNDSYNTIQNKLVFNDLEFPQS